MRSVIKQASKSNSSQGGTGEEVEKRSGTAFFSVTDALR